jgi:leucyl-tRNA synthetase
VSRDVQRLHLNTAVSTFMEFVNTATAFVAGEAVQREAPSGRALKEGVEALLLTMAPFAPHMVEELWQRTGHADSVFRQRWPAYDAAVATADSFELVIQVNGKVRARQQADRGTARQGLERLALAHERVKPHLEHRSVRKVIVVPDKLVNIVAS